MKAEIGRGRVPAAFRNVTDPVPARAGGTWLLLDAEAAILRYDARASLIWEAALTEPEFGPIREAFFVQNWSDSTPWRLRPLSPPAWAWCRSNDGGTAASGTRRTTSNRADGAEWCHARFEPDQYGLIESQTSRGTDVA